MSKNFRKSKGLLFLIICALVLGMYNTGNTHVFASSEGVTMNAPSNYKPTNTPLTSIFKGLQAMVDAPTLLLIEDVNPWSTSAHHTLIQSMGQVQKVSSSEAKNINFSAYDVVILSNDQNTGTYDNYASFKTKLEDYIINGGTVLFGAADNGWNNGNLNHDLPGGVKKVNEYVYQNKIIDNTHPIITAERSDATPITNSDLYSNYCSHSYFVKSTLPANSRIIVEGGAGKPTLVEYSLGNGTVIASGLTWEHNLIYAPNAFAKKAMDDLFMNSVFLANYGFFFNISPATGIVDDMVDMTVSVKGNPGIAGFSFDIEFDDAYIEAVDMIPLNGALSISGTAVGSLYSNMNGNAVSVTPSAITAVWSNDTNVDKSGDLFAIRVKIKDNAYIGKYPITLSGMVINDEYEELTYNVRQGILSVTNGLEVMYGDIYTDEIVNIKDVVKFAKYFAETVVFNTYETFAADVHKDDRIDIRDAIKLSQYVAGYENIVLGTLD